MNRKQQLRLEIIMRVQSGKMDKTSAAEALGVSRRQIDNIWRRFTEKGAASLVHGNCERAPVGKTAPDHLDQIIVLAGEGGKYHDYNISHLHDALQENEGLQIGRSTLDRLLKQKGIRQPRPGKPAVHRRRRQRRSAEGLLVQIDASSHAWFGAEQRRFALMGAVDDATSKILYLEFRHSEDQAGYLRLFRQVALDYGLPVSYYHDRHTLLQSPKTLTVAEELAGKQAQSELQRVLAALGVQSIAAHSPQAKGRIERLWATLQDRLVKELRVAGITALETANAFLPRFIRRYNARFAKEPQDPDSAWIPLGEELDRDYYFSVQETRVVRPDHTISWYGRTLLILRARHEPSLAGKTITVHTNPEAQIHLYAGKQPLRYQELAQRPTPPREEAAGVTTAPPIPTPHPQSRAKQCAWLHAGQG